MYVKKNSMALGIAAIQRNGGGFLVLSTPKVGPFLPICFRKSSVWGSEVQAFEGRLLGRVPRTHVFSPPPPVPIYEMKF